MRGLGIVAATVVAVLLVACGGEVGPKESPPQGGGAKAAEMETPAASMAREQGREVATTTSTVVAESQPDAARPGPETPAQQPPGPEVSAAGTSPVQPPREVRGPLPVPWAPAPEVVGIAPRPEVSALAAVVIDEASGAVLYDKNAYQPLPPASLTKVATAIVAIEHGNLDSVVETDVDSSRMRGSTVMGLLPGDQFTMRDLLYGLLLPSGNDAALAIGRQVASSDQVFVQELNDLLFRLGLDTAHFSNPHGLSARGHVISARDMAMLMRYAMTLPEFREIVQTGVHTAVGSRVIEVRSLNSFVFSYPGGDGAKVGYTGSAGRTLVASATREGHRLIAVVLNAESRDEDAARLLDWAFASHRWP